MIRRQVGDEYWLISQHEHALLSGELAKHAGHEAFEPPSGPEAVLGISLHDCGWPLHDDQPTLNSRHEPLDVFEAPRPITLPVWLRSVEIAIEKDPYAGLLVSLHALALSTLATGQSGAAAKSWDLSDPRARFEINVFQHRMIELQEQLRRKLGMRTDLPLKCGLADDSKDPAEVRLIGDFRWLQAMDILSLALCCTEPPFKTYAPLGLRFSRSRDQRLIVKPWPFSVRKIELKVPFRRLKAKRFENDAALRAELSDVPVEQLAVWVQRDTI